MPHIAPCRYDQMCIRDRTYNGPMKGSNLRTSIRITFEEAVFGCEKEIEMTLKDECTHCHGTGAKPGTSPQTCPKCNGRGRVVTTQQTMFGMIRNEQVCPECGGKGTVIKEKCPHCYGSGYTQSKKRIQVSVPAGIDNGQSIRIRGKGAVSYTHLDVYKRQGYRRRIK